ncbi:MAG TPA: PDGLE domain-containing protein [Micromonosporaceae bacterium]|nr:PDGLE domain-containing protein [Micromonosporaceae bacterium]
MKRKNIGFLLGGLLVALLIAGVVSNFASSAPDGLESAATKGCVRNADGEIIAGSCMGANAKEHELGDSPLAEYGLKGVDNAFLSTGLAGVTGVLLTFVLGGGLFWLARTRRPTETPDAGSVTK